MILILAHPEDSCADLTYQHLIARGADVAFIDPARLTQSLGLGWQLDGTSPSGTLVFDGRAVPLEAISGVLARAPYISAPDAELSPTDQKYLACELHAALVGVLHAFPGPVVNRPVPGPICRPVFTTIERLRRMAAHGFTLPPTLVTSRADHLRAFVERYGGPLLVGTLTGQRPTVELDAAVALASAEALVAEHPTFLERIPDGLWIDAFVVGGRVWGAAGGVAGDHTGRVGLDAQIIALDVDLQARCAAVARDLHLEFTQLAIVRAADGTLYCVDVQLLPAIDTCPARLQQELTAALADLLQGGERSTADDRDLWYIGRLCDGLHLRAAVYEACAVSPSRHAPLSDGLRPELVHRG